MRGSCIVSALLVVGLGASSHARPDDGRPSTWPWSLAQAQDDGSYLTLRQGTAAAALEACALALRDDAPDCVRVMSLLADRRIPLHRTLRQVVRDGRSAGAVVEAAAALAAMPDRDSVDLFVLALLRGRGGDAAVPALLDAWLAVEPAWVAHHLRFLAEFAPTPVARALAAERALVHGHPRDSHIAGLLAALEDTTLDGDHAARFRALAAEVRSRCDVASLPTTGKSQRCRLKRDVMRGLAPPSLARPARLDIRSRADVRRVGLALADHGDPRQFYAETGLGRRFRAPRVATDDTKVSEGDDAGRAPVRKRPLPAGPVPDVPAGVIDPTAFPPDFWGFDPALAQPPWYPRHLHLTIDDGPRPNTVRPVLDVLDRHGVKVVFFFVGASMIRRHVEDPAALSELLARTLAAGHRIGYHSMNHDTLPELHESEREPDQFADSVALFRWILDRLAGRPVPVLFGRFPGGRGAFHEEMPGLYAAAGLMQHVFWNFGPGFWQEDTPPWIVAGMACEVVRTPRPVTVLLHEFPLLAAHFDAFLKTIRTDCPASAGTVTVDPRTVWRKDHAFLENLCHSNHPDARGVCERWEADRALRRERIAPAGDTREPTKHGPRLARERRN